MEETRSGLAVEPEGEPGQLGSTQTASTGLKDVGGGTTGVAARSGAGGAAAARRTRGGGQGSPMTDSQAYTLLALALCILALPCIFLPKLAARVMFGSAAYPAEDQHTHTLGLLACGLLSAASAAFALESCARHNMLHTFTADTLKLALVAFATGNILLQMYYPTTLTPWGAIVAVLSQAATLALPASQLFVVPEDRNRVSRDFRRLPRNLGSVMWLRRRSLPAALYLILTMSFPLAGAAYFLAPKYTLYHTFGYAYGRSTYMIWKAIGASLMTVLPAITYTLKDKAENDLLARPLSRTLNFGLMLAAIGHLLVFGPIMNHGHGGFLLPILTANWATALLASMAGLAAPEAAAIMEQAAEAAKTE